MNVITAEQLARVATYADVIEALRAGFKTKIQTPVRHHHETSDVSTLLLMPAWSKDWTGLKTVVVKMPEGVTGKEPLRLEKNWLFTQQGKTIFVHEQVN